MTSGSNSVNYFPENQLTKSSTVDSLKLFVSTRNEVATLPPRAWT